MTDKTEAGRKPGSLHFGNEEANAVYIFGDLEADAVYPDVIIPLLEFEHSEEPLEIYVSTLGGDPHSALTIAEIIDRLTVPTTLILMGEVASAGFIIAVSGASNPNVETVAFPSIRAMWHWPRIYATKESLTPWHEYQDYADDTQSFNTYLADYIVSHTSMTKDMLYTSCDRRDWWLNANDLIEYGIIDRIVA